MLKERHSAGGMKSLDSLVDIVSNIVGILIILAAFMALFGLVDPANPLPERQRQPTKLPPKKVLVPWSHSTNKNAILFALNGNRLLHLDMRAFYKTLAGIKSGSRPSPVTIKQEGVRIRFFPVTPQVYCLEFLPSKGAGETWMAATKGDSLWNKAKNSFPPEKFYYFFWVAGDSFELFRDVREGLWEENFEVGWKPAENGKPLEICSGFEGSRGFQPQ